MPSREPSRTTRCCRTSSAAPSAAVTGALPKTRVRWPSPCRLASSSDSVPEAANTSCIGATLRWRRGPGRPLGSGRPRRPACRCRPSGCRAGRPSPRGSSARGAARPGRPPEASGPATEASPGPPRGSGPVSSRSSPSTRFIRMVRNVSMPVRENRYQLSSQRSILTCRAHRPFYLDILRGHGRKCRYLRRRNEHGACWAHGRSQPRQMIRLAAARPRLSSTEISVEPRTTVSAQLPRPGRGHRRRRGARRLRHLRPQRHRRRRAAAAAPPPARPPTGSSPVAPGEEIRPGTVERFNKANPDAKIKATTFQNDAYKTKIKTAIGAGQAPTHHLGLGRRRSAQLRRGQPGRGPHRVVRRERRGQGPPVPLLLRRGDDRRQDLRDAGRDGPADRAVLQQDGLRQGRRRAARSPGATS